MLLNRLEYALMNNPVRAAVQRYCEAPRLLELGGPMEGGTALELGCGRGVGAELILDVFGLDTVDGFDLDPSMVRQARRRLEERRPRVRWWVGDATSIPAVDGTYDAVFDFGAIHHVPDWRRAVAEIARVLEPGGRFYGEEVLEPFIRRTRHLLEHPRNDRFDSRGFILALEDAGISVLGSRQLGRSVTWFVGSKTSANG